MLQAVLLDVDFTLFRPGPELGPQGYARIGARHGLTLDTERYEAARLAAIAELQLHPELVHDTELWVRFTESIVVGMGGDPVLSRSCAVELVREWERHENFFLYDDTLPDARRAPPPRPADRPRLERPARPRRVRAAPLARRRRVRRLAEPRAREAAPLHLRGGATALETGPEDAAMVGDSFADDIAGARALGMRAILLDRDGLHVDEPDRIDTLLALPAALGLMPS